MMEENKPAGDARVYGPRAPDKIRNKFDPSRLDEIEAALGITGPNQEFCESLAWYLWKAINEPNRRPDDDSHKALARLKGAVDGVRKAMAATSIDDAGCYVGDFVAFASCIDDFDGLLAQALRDRRLPPKKEGRPFNSQHQMLKALLRPVESFYIGKNTVYSRKENEYSGPLFLMFKECSRVAGWELSDRAIAEILADAR
ncbi:MAG TPA: hypothetical protein VMB83_16135, partial [Roseiarcus sp.]|nr:hypothetical protein [Roseiarcus sp.]